MADPISASISAIVTYVSGSFAAVAAGTATLAQTATVVAVQVGVSAAATAVLTPQVDAAGSPTDWRADTDAAIHFVAGRRGVAGTIVHRDEWGKDNRYQSIVTVFGAAGPYKSIGSITADGESVTFSGPYGRQSTGTWNDIFWGEFSLGAQPATALRSPSDKGDPTIGGTMPGWGSAYKLSGKAAAMFTLAMDKERKRWPSGEPKMLSVLEGMFCWDPRQDSTYPGGSGSCRLADPSTWVWSDNPLLHALKWALGYYENGVLVGGIGAAVTGIDVAAYVEGANVSDANGWRVSAYPSTKDDKHQVLLAFLQAGGCRYARKGGKISCIVRTPRTSIVDVTAADTAGPFEIEVGADMLDRLNTVVPRCAMESHDWEMVAQAPVSVSAYVTADGARRERGIDYPYVAIQPSRGNTHQPAQLAAYDIVDSREPIRGRVPLKPYMAQIQPGDVFTIDEPGFLLDGVECLCVQREFDPQQDIVQITFVSETEGKHAFALGQDPTPPEPPALTAPDIYSVAAPEVGAFIAAAGTGNQPQIVVAADADNVSAQSFIVDVRPAVDPADGEAWDDDDAGWEVFGTYPISTTRVTVTGLEPETAYQIGVRYISEFGVIGERIVLDTVTTGALVATGFPGLPASELIDSLDAVSQQGAELVEDLTETGDLAAEALFRLAREVRQIQDRVDALGYLEGVPVGTQLVTEREVRETESEAAALARDAISVQVGNNHAFALSQINAVATDLTSEVNARVALGTTVGANYNYFEDRVDLVTTNLSSEVAARTALGVTVGDNHATALSEINAVATDLTSEVNARVALGTTVGDNYNYFEDRVDLVTTNLASTASTVTALGTTVGDNYNYFEDRVDLVTTNLSSEIAARTALGTTVGNNHAYLLDQVSLLSDADGSFGEMFELLGVTNGTDTAFVLNKSTVQIGPDGTLASVLSGLQAADATNTSSIATLQTVTTGHASILTTLSNTSDDHDLSITQLFDISDDLALRAALVLNFNDVITGYEIDGIASSIMFSADHFGLATTAGGTTYYPFLISDGKIGFTGDVSMDGNLLVLGTVKANSIEAGNLGLRAAAYLDEFVWTTASGTISSITQFNALLMETADLPVKPGSMITVQVGHTCDALYNSFEYFYYKDDIELVIQYPTQTVEVYTPPSWQTAEHIHKTASNVGAGANVGVDYALPSPPIGRKVAVVTTGGFPWVKGGETFKSVRARLRVRARNPNPATNNCVYGSIDSNKIRAGLRLRDALVELEGHIAGPMLSVVKTTISGSTTISGGTDGAGTIPPINWGASLF